MKIFGREEHWIHTHFLTDCRSLSETRRREVVKDMTPYLRELGIVYDMHFMQMRDEPTCRIVLECIPFSSTLDRIQQKLQEVVKDIPARPAITQTVRDEQSQAPLVASR
jgi:hypothetical protein